MKFRQYILIIISLVLFSLLSSCSPWVELKQGLNNQWILLNSDSSVGQTFVANYSGLQAIYFLLAPQSPGNGILTLHLSSAPSSSVDLITVKLPIQEINSTRMYRFDFLNIPNSSNQYYFAYLTIDGDGSVQVGSGPANGYQNGAAYQNYVPIEAQLTFNLDYDLIHAYGGLFQQVLHWIIICIAGTLLLSIPGWALLSLFWKNWKDLIWLIKLTLSIGVSMGLYTLIALFTFLLHIHLGRWYAWVPIISGILIILWCNRHRLVAKNFIKNLFHFDFKNRIWHKSSFWQDICLIIVLVLILLSRFWAVRGLEQPMWNDSVHHTEITQLIMDNQGLFTSWLPYAPYQTFSMHYGFPLTAALLGWITGLESGQSVLYVGQILNILACLALYPIAIRISRGNRMSGVIAVLVAGLLSPMPAFYVNWGRYAQLAGQVILPICMWMVWEVVDNPSMDPIRHWWQQLPWVKIIISGIAIVGMILFEFRMLFIIITFVVSLSLGQLIKHSRSGFLIWLRELAAILLIGLISILLFLPWGIRLQHSNLINYADISNGVKNLFNLVQQDYQTWRNIAFYVPVGLIFLGILSWLWAVIKRNWSVVSIGIWVAMMASLYSLILLHIPWVQYVQSFAVIISLYIPVGLLLGYLAGECATWFFHEKLGKIAIYIMVVFFGFWGVWNQKNISNPSTYAFVTRPDTLAMLWIQQETPLNSRFLVEGTHENWATNIIGTDAGWWIPLLAFRENTMPPQYAIANEKPIVADYSQKLVNLEADLEQVNLDSKAGISLMCEYGITHVYIGQKQGMVGNTGKSLFTPSDLATSSVFRLIYHQDRVYIYSVEGACGQ